MSESNHDNKIGMWQTLIPVAVGILAIDIIPVENEILRWVLTAIITVVAFVVCIMIGNKQDSVK